MRSVLEGSRAWLQGSHIHVPDDWLSACVEWIHEENQGGNPGQDQVNSLVYEQWLLADLHELETQCLPAEVHTTAKYELTGTYSLQVDSILDVGQSFYSQQLKVKGTENGNVVVSADDPHQKPWEPKPTRMLLMKLTDGKHSVQAMEYHPISSLNPQTVPGTKVHVTGPVLCRRAVLMLAESNIRVLGGEVDTLIEANTPLNVLQSAMEASTEFAGKCHKQQFNGSVVTYPNKDDSKCSVGSLQFNTRQQGVPGNSVVGNNRGSLSQFRGGSVKREVHSQKPAVALQMADEQWDDDGFLDEMEIDNFDHLNVPAPLDRHQQARPGTSSIRSNGPHHPRLGTSNNRPSIERPHIKTSASQQGRLPVGGGRIQGGVTPTGRMSNRNNLGPPSNVGQTGIARQTLTSHADEFPDFEDMDFDDFGEDFNHVSKNTGNRHSASVPKTSGNAKNSNTITEHDIPDMGDFTEGFETVSRNISNNLLTPAASSANLETFDDLFDGDDDDFDFFGEDNSSMTISTNITVTSNKRNYNSLNPSLATQPSTHATKQAITPVNRHPPGAGSVNLQQGNLHPPIGSREPMLIKNVNINITVGPHSPAQVQPTPLQPAQRGQRSGNIGIVPLPRGDTGPAHSTGGPGESEQRKKPKLMLGKVRADTGPTNQPSVRSNQSVMPGVIDEPTYNITDSDSHYPYMYLTTVIKQPVLAQARIYTIKAYISTLTSKLTQVNNWWCLSCKINDGTMSMDVDLSNKVLTQLIGFSAAESQVMKQRAKTDRGVRDVLQEGIRQCQQRLVELYGLMELEVSDARPRPVVLVTRQVNGHHIELLYNRVMSSWHKIQK